MSNRLVALEGDAPQSVTVIILPWIDVERRIVRRVAPGDTLARIVTDGVPLECWRENLAVRVTIGCWAVEAGLWERVRPKAGTVVVVRIVPGNSSMLRSVLLLSASVAAMALGQYYVGPALAEAAGLGSGLGLTVARGAATAGLLMAGTFLVNALVPIRPAASTGGAANSPSYAISGWRNPINPNGPVPLILGEHRYAWTHAAYPWRTTRNGENYARALLTAGYGPLAISDARLGDTPISKYQEVTLELREGYPTDGPVTIYPSQVFETGDMQVELLSGRAAQFGPDTRWFAAAATKLALEVTFPAGLIAYTEVQQGQTRVQQQGAWSVAFHLRYRAETDADFTTIGDWTVSGIQQRALTAIYEWDVPVRGPRYEIEFSRVSTDWDRIDQTSQTWKIVSRSYWTAIRSFRPEYPINFAKPIALAAIEIRATEQLNGTIDNFNTLLTRVCKDWDAATQTWVVRATRNPASLFRFVLQCGAYCYPRADSKIDLERLQYWHERCTALGLSYDRVHDFTASLNDVLADIAAAGRARKITRAGKVSVAIDEAGKDIVAYIGPRNATAFSGRILFVRHPDALRCRFPDRTNNYEMSERIVPRPGLVEDPVTVEDISLPGITDPSVIYRELLRRHYEMELRRNEYYCTQQYEALTAELFDRVGLSHDVLDEVKKQARVTRVSGQMVCLDDTIEMKEGQSYAVIFRRPGASDTLPDIGLQRIVRTVSGETNVLYLVGDGAVPAIGELAVFGLASSVIIDCVVKEIEAGEGMARHLTLVDYASEIFALADGATVPPWNGAVGQEISFTETTPAVPIIGDITSTAISPQSGTSTLFVPVSPGSGGGTVARFELDHRLVGAPSWTTVSIPVGEIGAKITTYHRDDIVELRARAIGPGGSPLMSAYTTAITHMVASGDPQTMAVTSFSVTQINATTWQYSFVLNQQPVGTGVRIKYRSGHWTAWTDLTSQFGGVITSSPYDSTTPAIVSGQEYSFGAVAIDSSGSESGDPIVVHVTAA